MAQNKSLTVSFFGRDVTLNKTLDGIKKNTFATSNVLEQANKKATMALTGLGVAAFKFAQAAAEDEKSAASLANTLKTVTNSSAAQIASVEKFISKTESWSAVMDDKIRPAFDTLVRSTKDVGKAQKMTTLALEIAQKQGLDVTEVADAMAKASRGQYKALANITKVAPQTAKATTNYGTAMKVVNGQLVTMRTNLGKTQKSTETLDSYLQRVNAVYSGSIAAASETAAFKFQQFKVAMDNVQETLGGMLLPYMKKFADKLIEIQPFVEKHKDAIFQVGAAIASVALGIKAINAAYKAFKFVELIGNLVLLGTTAATAGAEGAAAGVAISAAWAPFLAGVAAIGGLAALGLFVFNAVKNRNDKTAVLPQTTGIQAAANAYTTPYSSAALGSKPLPKLPRLAKGGIVNKPTIAMIGEAGPEAIVPLSRGGAGGIVIINHIQGSVVTEKEISLKIRNDMAQLLRRKGLNPSVLGV